MLLALLVCLWVVWYCVAIVDLWILDFVGLFIRLGFQLPVCLPVMVHSGVLGFPGLGFGLWS